MAMFMSTKALTLKIWLPIIGIGLANLVIVEIIKVFFTRQKDSEAI
jgi:hypothetical protein